MRFRILRASYSKMYAFVCAISINNISLCLHATCAAVSTSHIGCYVPSRRISHIGVALTGMRWLRYVSQMNRNLDAAPITVTRRSSGPRFRGIHRRGLGHLGIERGLQFVGLCAEQSLEVN
ncbi:hypothetical protein PUN28_018835 [Cardiocondyla obscurior]|uniref:Secreted protein n=1 Tax=Cardiocondyla obscurior TaxID=286306 RepID=A0AAW2EDL8_9HYME